MNIKACCVARKIKLRIALPHRAIAGTSILLKFRKLLHSCKKASCLRTYSERVHLVRRSEAIPTVNTFALEVVEVLPLLARRV